MAPNTKPRSVRIEDDIWERAAAKAKAEGDTLSAVIRRALKSYAPTPAYEDPEGRPTFEYGGQVMVLDERLPIGMVVRDNHWLVSAEFLAQITGSTKGSDL
jgi:hypothetical protein